MSVLLLDCATGFGSKRLDVTQLAATAVPPYWDLQFAGVIGRALVWSTDAINDAQRGAVVARLLASRGYWVSEVCGKPPRWARALPLVQHKTAPRVLAVAARARLLGQIEYPTVGSLFARVLLIGERTSGWERYSGAPRLPFVGLTLSSAMATRLLREAGISELDVHWCNSATECGRPLPLSDLHQALPDLQVAVTLGGVATRASRDGVLDAGLRHVEFYHPSWINRFHHHRVNSFARELADRIRAT